MSAWEVIPADAPDVMVTGVDVMRSSSHPRPGPEDEEPETLTRWNIFGRLRQFEDDAQSDGPALTLFGDLSVIENGWGVAVTSIVTLRFRDAIAEVARSWTREQIDDAVAVYGAWANHILYDTASSRARALAVQSYATDMTIPLISLKPSFLRVASVDEDAPSD